MKRILLLSVLIALFILPDIANSQPTRRRNVFADNMGYCASIARNKHRKPLANGEVYNENTLVAGHRSLAFGTIVRVTSVETGKEVEVTIKDRGPYANGRVIDVSYAASKKLGIAEGGAVLVRIKVIGREAVSSNRLASNAVVSDGSGSSDAKVGTEEEVVAPPTREEPQSVTPPAQHIVTASQTGKASYYADRYHGRQTASGELYDKDAMTAAHRTFPFGTKLRVTNLENNQSVEVVVNDRGPYADTRIIDLSRAAAEKIGMVQAGIIQVKIEQIK